MDIIECKGITRRFADGKGEGRVILDGVSFGAHEGEVFTIIGPSGSGKTSLLRVLNRLDEPDSGEVLFRGERVVGFSPHELRRRVAMAFQQPKLFGPNVMDDLRYPFTIDSKTPTKDEIEERARELMGFVGLDREFVNRDVDRLSGGEAMRVAIARALMRRPEVLLLDEPTAGLDPKGARGLLETITELNQSTGLTIVAVTHGFAYAKLIGHRTMLIDRGRVTELGDTKEFFDNPKTAFAREFIGNDNAGMRPQ